jgi:heme/copper-type cytochrome/quinol oxidase subunit 4
MKRILGFSLFVILTLLQSVSAHGGEDSEGLSNLQIMLISLAICAVFYLLFRKLSDSESSANNGLLLTLVAYTGTVHILLGLNDMKFLLGGLGIIAIAIAPFVTEIARPRERLLQPALALLALTMFIAYFVSNHDLHYIAEDYLGLTTKFSEIGIIGLVINHNKNKSSSTIGE